MSCKNWSNKKIIYWYIKKSLDLYTCKSIVTTLSAPAFVIKFETSFADIEVLGTTFLSCLAYPK